jgi:hypothetical protein
MNLPGPASAKGGVENSWSPRISCLSTSCVDNPRFTGDAFERAHSHIGIDNFQEEGQR